jgi:hypothetical protein
MLTHDEIRAAVLAYIRAQPNGSVPPDLNIFGEFEAQGKAVQSADRELACQMFYELALDGVIVPGIGPNTNSLLSWPFYRVTEYGKQVLGTPEYQPHDPGGYIKRLRTEIPAVDGTIVRYLDESLACFQRRTLLASAVMLGCAAEKAALLLVDVFGTAIRDPVKQQQYEKETKNWMISRKYDALWKRLEPLAKGLPKELGDDLHTILDRVFDLIRTTRNEAGHPTGKIVDRDVMTANLILFPSYCRRVYCLIEHFSHNSAM